MRKARFTALCMAAVMGLSLSLIHISMTIQGGSEFMPLTMARQGEVTSIKRVGGKEEVRRHLENMGFVPGTDVTVVSVNNGNVIVNVREARVAISREMAGKIMI